MPKVSIVVPVHNVEKYLGRCLDSIMAQDFRDFEAILVVNGSTDGSLRIAGDYVEKDRRFSLICLDCSSLSEARNKGLEAASGEYVLFIDSDDWMDGAMVGKLYSALVSGNACMAVCGFAITDEATTVIGKKPDIPMDNIEIRDEDDRILLMRLYFSGSFRYQFNVWNKLYDRKLLADRNMKFRPTGEVFAEDVLFNFHVMLSVCRIAVVNEPLYFYRQRNGSIMKSHKKDFFERYLNLHSYLSNGLEESGLYPMLASEYGRYCFRMYMNAVTNEKIAPKGLPDKYKAIRKMTRSKAMKKHIADARLDNTEFRRKLIWPLYMANQSLLIYIFMILFVKKPARQGDA